MAGPGLHASSVATLAGYLYPVLHDESTMIEARRVASVRWHSSCGEGVLVECTEGPCASLRPQGALQAIKRFEEARTI